MASKLVMIAVLGGCGRHAESRPSPRPAAEQGGAPVVSDALASRPQAVGGGPRASASRGVDRPPPPGHPRIFLTADRLARVRRHALVGTPAWRRVEQQCEEAARARQPSGYEAWDWSEIVADCSLVWQATRRSSAAATALTYFRALLDDHETVGDAKGGDRVVEHDHGYPIRTYAFYTALGYDWLHDAPQMTAELREKAVRRLDTWLDWYKKDGYLRDKPIANYFTGYFGALAAAAFATAGENQAPLVDRVEQTFDDLVAPVYAKSLKGGDWPEGWQYGDGAILAMALFVDGERTVFKKDELARLPWLREVVAHHAHALYPDGVGVYDNGDWSSRPARLAPRGLFAIAAVVPEGDPAGKQARYIARLLPRPKGGDGAWVEPLGDEPGAPAQDPRTGTPSLLMPGTGLAFARSDWTPHATFLAFQCGPRLSDDHQHADAGHFTIVRGGDPLFVDVSDYGSYSTINHNSLLVDDGGKGLDYAPNQGTWGTNVGVSRFADRGRYVYVEGDFADAYRPSKAEWGTKNPVDKADRAIVFVRPSTFIIYDRVVVERPDVRVTWEAHTLSEPASTSRSMLVVSGRSRAELFTLLPADAKHDIVKEPTERGDGPFVSNNTYAPSFRIETGSDAKGNERQFLHVIEVADAEAGAPGARAAVAGPAAAKGRSAAPSRGAAQAAAPPSLVESGDTIGLSLVPSGGEPTFVVFGRRTGGLGAGVRYTAPRTATKHLVADLRPGAHYAVSTTPASELCRVSIQPGPGPSADEAGTLLLEVDTCGNP